MQYIRLCQVHIWNFQSYLKIDLVTDYIFKTITICTRICVLFSVVRISIRGGLMWPIFLYNSGFIP